MRKGFAKIELKSLKQCGNFLDLLLAATGNEANYGSPSFLTKEIGSLNKSTLRRTTRGLKTLMAKGLITQTKNGTYHAFASEAEKDFVLIPNAYRTFYSNDLKVIACLIYAHTLGKKTGKYQIEKLTGLRADIEPILAKIEASELIENRKDLLATLDKTAPVPQKWPKKAISKSTQAAAKKTPIVIAAPIIAQTTETVSKSMSDEDFYKMFGISTPAKPAEIAEKTTEIIEEFDINKYIKHVEHNYTGDTMDPLRNCSMRERRSPKAQEEEYMAREAKFYADYPEELAALEANRARQELAAIAYEEEYKAKLALFK